VYDPQRFESQAVGFFQVGFHHAFHIAGRNAVQVKNIGDGNADWLVHKQQRPDLSSRQAGP